MCVYMMNMSFFLSYFLPSCLISWPFIHSFIVLIQFNFRNTHAILALYEITLETSIENLEKWLEEAKRYGPEDCLIVIVGTKSDLEHSRKVQSSAGKVNSSSSSSSLPSMVACYNTLSSIFFFFLHLLLLSSSFFFSFSLSIIGAGG